MEKSLEPKIGRIPRRKAYLNDHTICGQRLGRIEGDMQSMKMDVKQVQSKCTNSTRTLTKLENQMSQLMSMMGDIKIKIGIERPLKAEDEQEPEEILFPSRLEEKQKQDEDELVSFLNLFKTLNVNLPLIELIDKFLNTSSF
ncbi:acidic leucine-rich nuclear phosphoprotein 32 family member B-like [Gossypium australe]|uniref:Acidic leucine-rich nuclear phosphoprotein 32 family member B-like n=1 Tax=Gossypium australe TaxID=47621 RepID=A0A5B6VVG2_9ROSI|nr:acidic leucine-rich nuclear phosphoprotein 32 family member B-like [Gossypium australe]